MADKFAGYDDAQVTLGDGCLNIESAMFGVEKVAGSRSFVRDPRLSQLVRGQGSSRPDYGHVVRMPGMKWCSEHDGDGWMPLSDFSPDTRYRDGKHPVCKLCRARHQRKLYALQKEAEGKEVRPYRGSSRPSY